MMVSFQSPGFPAPVGMPVFAGRAQGWTPRTGHLGWGLVAKFPILHRLIFSLDIVYNTVALWNCQAVKP